MVLDGEFYREAVYPDGRIIMENTQPLIPPLSFIASYGYLKNPRWRINWLMRINERLVDPS